MRQNMQPGQNMQPPMGQGGGQGMGEQHGEWANKSVNREQAMQNAGKHFDRMDTNHDGMMSPEERRAGIEQMREKMHERMTQRKQN